MNNIIFKQSKLSNKDELEEFFSQPKALQRLAFVGREGRVPSVSYWDVVVADDYAVIESGCISAARGLHGIFPSRRTEFKWKYSKKSKRCQQLNYSQRCLVKGILEATSRYEFVKQVPADALSSTVLKDILYGKITNPKDAITAYGKRLGIKHFNEYMINCANNNNIPISVMCSVINPAQLATYVHDHGKLPRGAEFRDMVEQAYALEETINLMWSEKRMQEEHTNWSRRLMRLQVHTKSEEPIWPESVVKTFEQCGLELCNTEQRVFEEGYIMHHCVYTNYWPNIKRKEYLALRMELEGGPVTIGLRKRRGDDTYSFDQAYHKYDKVLDNDEMGIVLSCIEDNPIVVNLLEAMAYEPKGNKKNSPIEEFNWDLYENREELPW